MQEDFEYLTQVWENDIIWMYNKLHNCYKWNSEVLILLWVAFKQALDWNTGSLMDFETFLENNSAFNSKSKPIKWEVKLKVWDLLYDSDTYDFMYEIILEDIEEWDDVDSKIRLIRRFTRNLWLVGAWNYNSRKSIWTMFNSIANHLWISIRNFTWRFPNLASLMQDIIPNWKIDFSKWLDYVISALFIMWNPENRMDNLRALNSSLSWLVWNIYKREEDLRVKKEILSLMLISVWIYIDSKIFQTWDVLTEAEAETLKNELIKRFWDNLPQSFIDKITSLEDTDIEDIIILIEDLIFAEVVKLFGHVDTSFSEFLSGNSSYRDSIRIKARVFYKIRNMFKIRNIELDRELLDIWPEIFRAKMNSYLQQYFEDFWIAV